MLKKVRVLFVLSGVLAATLLSCTSVQKYNYNVSKRRYSPQELKADISILRSSLQEAHPGLYWYVSKKDLDFKFDSINKAITDSLTLQQFYRLTAPVVAQIRCGHTRVITRAPRLTLAQLKADKKKGKSLLSQLDYRIEDGKLYVVKTYSKDTLIRPGDELVTINSLPVMRVLDTASTLFSSDGYNTTFFNRALERNPYGWYRTLEKRTDTLHLQIRDSVYTRSVTYIRKVVRDTTKSKTEKLSEKATRKSRYKGKDEHNNPILQLRYLDKDSTIAWMKVGSFSFANNNHGKFYKESFADIRKHHVKKLILDLRYNGGGSLRASRNLFAYLSDSPFVFLGKTYANKRNYRAPLPKLFQISFLLRSLFLFRKADSGGYVVNLKGSKPLQPKTNHFDGKLQVLINGYSFSASTLLSANLKRANRATFIGEETGGGFNQLSAGQLPLVSLPHTKLILRLPLFSISPNASVPVKGHGIYPDYTIVPTAKDLSAGKDRELEKALSIE